MKVHYIQLFFQKPIFSGSDRQMESLFFVARNIIKPGILDNLWLRQNSRAVRVYPESENITYFYRLN